MVTQPTSPRHQAPRPDFLSRPLGSRCPRRSSPTCATRCLPRSSSPATASAPRTRSRRAMASAGSSRAMRCAPCRRSASPRSGWARAAARASRAAIRGCSPRRSRCSSTSPASAPPRSWTRSAPSNASPPSLPPRTPPTTDIARLRQLVADAEASIDDAARFTQLGARIPSRRRRGLAQPRAGGAAHLAAARVVAAPQSDADAEGRAAHPRRSQGAAGADRDPRRRRRAQADGRPRQDDPRPPGVGACARRN